MTSDKGFRDFKETGDLSSSEIPIKGSVLITGKYKESCMNLVGTLQKHFYFCRFAVDPEHVKNELTRITYDVIFVDIGSKEKSSEQLIQNIHSRFPSVLIITFAEKENIDCAVSALEIGAQDYLVKPFIMSDVIGKIESALLRTRINGFVSTTYKIYQGDLTIAYNSRRVWLSGKELFFTNIEFRILQELAINANLVIEYDALLEKVWGYEYCGERNYLHEYVRIIRNKIDPGRHNHSCIVNVNRVGYRFEHISE
jgi:DNA-binding response OmpR family regulator